MAAATQDAPKQRFYAGLYQRTKTLTRFWGRVEKQPANEKTAEIEQPWTGLADWLRAAHSLLDDKTTE